jgi:hypothetical protein
MPAESAGVVKAQSNPGPGTFGEPLRLFSWKTIGVPHCRAH